MQTSTNTPSSQDPNKVKSLEAAISAIEKQFGKGSIMRMGTKEKVEQEVIGSGSLSIDIALGIGGYAKGRVIEIYGPESSGKTTLTLHAIAECQRAGGVCAFVDAEHALDVRYAENLGVKVKDLLISQPDTGEQALEIAEMLIRSSSVDLVVIDSVAALVPKAEIEGDMGDAQMGAQARLMSQALRKLTAALSRSNTCMIFINQIRMKIGVMFGSPETTTGGNALKFYASTRIDVRKIGSLKNGEDVIGNRTRVKIVKNKMAAPFKEAEFDIIYNKGICAAGDLLDLAANENFIEKSGSWYSLDGERLGQGREAARAYLEEHPEKAKKIREKILAKFQIRGNGNTEAAPAAKTASSPAPSDKKAPSPAAAKTH